MLTQHTLADLQVDLLLELAFTELELEASNEQLDQQRVVEHSAR